MATDISLVNNVVKITIDSGRPRQYSLATATYAFNENDVLNLTIDGQNYSVALADLRINGAGSAPVSTAAALTSLSSTFPAWNQTSYTLNEILATGNDAGTFTIDNLSDPTTDQQAATKKYVDDNAGGGSLGYLVYTALIDQTGTSAPTATVLTNTLGGTIVYSYEDVGFYRLTLEAAFPAAKTFVQFGAGQYLDLILSWEHGGDANSILIYTSYSADGTNQNNYLQYTPIEIRVYP